MRKTISFSKYYKKEYEYLENINNASEYICQLIRKDRLKSNNDLEEKILQILKTININDSNLTSIKSNDRQFSRRKKESVRKLIGL